MLNGNEPSYNKKLRKSNQYVWMQVVKTCIFNKHLVAIKEIKLKVE